jgi:hypothetical protein
MLDLDLCNDCRQGVGIHCTLVYPLNVNKISYLVGKPFYSTFLLYSRSYVGLCCRSVKMLICSVLWKNSILFSYAASCKISSDV